MIDKFSRTKMLLGEKAIEKLKNSTVAVFGIGGVGGHTAEALIRSGIGTLHIIDNDTINITNINRQIFATSENIGQLKTESAKKRLSEINPDAVIITHNMFFLPHNSAEFDFSGIDYIVDAVDTVSAKIELIMQAKKHNIPIISSMGTGNKLDPTQFKVSDIYKTKVCPLARVMRYELKKRGIKSLKTVYSEEKPITPENYDNEETSKRATPGSTSFVPSVAGLIIAGEVIKDLCKTE